MQGSTIVTVVAVVALAALLWSQIGVAETPNTTPDESAPRFESTKTYAKPSDAAIKNTLSDVQFYVTQENGTERPFANEFWNNKKAGIYVDVVSGEPLFSSTHKFRSGTGWPSFYQPLIPEHVIEKKDTSHFMVRIEVRSKFGDSHLGHLFKDGPAPTGLRYCINSASLRFVPAEKLDVEGYGEFKVLFAKEKES